jgi:hypothetical protein
MWIRTEDGWGCKCTDAAIAYEDHDWHFADLDDVKHSEDEGEESDDDEYSQDEGEDFDDDEYSEDEGEDDSDVNVDGGWLEDKHADEVGGKNNGEPE